MSLYTGNAGSMGHRQGSVPVHCSVGECYSWVILATLVAQFTVAKSLEHWTLVIKVWGSNPPVGDISQQYTGKFGNLL